MEKQFRLLLKAPASEKIILKNLYIWQMLVNLYILSLLRTMKVQDLEQLDFPLSLLSHI